MEPDANKFDLENIMDDIDTEAAPLEFGTVIETRIGDVSTTYDNVMASSQWLDGVIAQEAQTAYLVKTFNAQILSETKGLDFQFAFDNMSHILGKMYPGEEVSGETFAGRLRLTYDKRKAQNEIYIKTFAQMWGDDSERTANEIRDLEIGMPNSSRLDEISAMLADKDQRGKFFIAMGGVPHVLASQMPMWIDQAKFGAMGAAVWGGYGAWSGAGALASAATGFLYGAGMYEFALESGEKMYHLKEKFGEAGVPIDEKQLRFSSSVSAALITALDVMTFKGLAGDLVQQNVHTLASAMRDGITKRIAFGHIGKNTLIAMSKEGLTEGMQEVIGDINEIQTTIMANNRMRDPTVPYPGDDEAAFEGPEYMDVPGADQLWTDFKVAAYLSGPMAGLAAGAGATFVSARASIIASRSKGELDAMVKANATTSKAVDQAVDSVSVADIDIADTEIVNEPVPNTPGEPVKTGETILPTEAAVAEGIDRAPTKTENKIETVSQEDIEIAQVELDQAVETLQQAEVELTEEYTQREATADEAAVIKKIKDHKAKLEQARAEGPPRTVVVNKYNAKKFNKGKGTLTDFLIEGVRVAENIVIKGTMENPNGGEQYILVQTTKTSPVTATFVTDLMAKTGLTARKIMNRVDKAENQSLDDPSGNLRMNDQPPHQAIMKIIERTKDHPEYHRTVVFKEGPGDYITTTDEKQAYHMYATGLQVVGYIDQNQETMTSNMQDVADAFAWTDYFVGKEEFNVPEGTVLHIERDDAGNETFYYYEGEIADRHETLADQAHALRMERMLEEEQEIGPINDEELAVAGGQLGVQQVSNEMDLIEMVDEKYAPTTSSGIRILWQKLKRINYSNKVVRTRRDLAQLFSAFRHPNVEHVHVVYVDSRNRIIANTCESSGLASSTALNTEAIGPNMESMGATGFYMIHNHPSGNVTVSGADQSVFLQLSDDYPDAYKGGIILNHDKYSWSAPGTMVAKQEAYNPVARYAKPPQHEYTQKEVADEVGNRGTAIFVLSGIRKVRAVVSPTRNLTAAELYQVTRDHGGSFYNIASNDPAIRAHYAEVGQSIQGTELAQMGLVMEVKKTGEVVESFRGKLTGDKMKLREQREMTLWEEEDASFEATPRTIKAWKTFWESIKSQFQIRRPHGIYNVVYNGSDTVSGPYGDTLVEANTAVHEEGYEMDIHISDMKGEFPKVSARYEVVQGDDGLTAGMKPDQEVEIDTEQKLFMDNMANVWAAKLFGEGQKFKMEDLDLAEPVQEAMEDFEAKKDVYKLEAITTVLEDAGLKSKIMTLSEALKELDQNDKQNTDEFHAIQETLYRMGQMYAELEGMSSKGLNRVKKLASDLARSKLSPLKFKEGIELTVQEYDVRLPLSKKQGLEYEKIKDLPKEKLNKKERAFVEWVEKPGLDTLGFMDLERLKLALENYWKMRYSITKVWYGDKFVPIKSAIDTAIEEFMGYNKNRVKDVDPADALTQNVVRKAGAFMRNFIVDRQMQFFMQVEHIAGPNSLAYQVFYRNMESGDVNMRRYRHTLQDKFRRELQAQGITGKEIHKWTQGIIEMNDRKITNAQALEIYMHSLAEDNRSAMYKAGMYYSDINGARHFLDPQLFNFEDVVALMAKDEVAQKVALAFREVYDDLGETVGSVYKTMFGREWTYEENYYPKKVAREFYKKGQQEINSVTIDDKGQNRLSIATDYLLDRTAEDPPLELNTRGAFATLSTSMIQEAKFVHLEMPLFQASKLLYDPNFKSAVENTRGLGEQYWRLIEKGLQDWAGRTMELDRTWDKVLLSIRRNATRAGLGFNPFSASKAAISWFYSLRYLDPRSAQEGLRRAALPNAKDQLMQKSAVFRDRVMGGSLPEVHDIMMGKDVTFAEHGMPKKGSKDYDSAMFWMLTAVDAKTVTAVMEGAIFQAETAFRDFTMTDKMVRALGFGNAALKVMTQEEKVDAAVRWAEYVLQRTQPDFRPQSRNAFQRGTPIERLASVFGSFNTITHGMFWDMIHRLEHEGLQSVGINEVIWTGALMMIVLAGNEGVERLKKWALKRDQSTLVEIIQRGMLNNTFIVRDLNEIWIAKWKYGSYAGKGGTDSFVKGMDLGITGAVLTLDGLLDQNKEDVLEGITNMVDSIATFSGAPVAATGYAQDFIEERLID